MDRKRPQGRQKYVTDNSKGVHRRGSGLGTGPVGSSQSGGQGGGRASGGSSGGMNPLMIIIVLVIALLGGGGGLFGALSGGSSDYGISENTIQNISQNSNSSGWTDTSNASGEKLDESVAKGSRAKRTEILGDGQDQVTVMVYMCGTDLESKSGMATRDLMEMTKASIGDNVNVVVYTGGCSKWNNQVIRNDVNQIYEVVSGGLKCVNQNAGSDAMTKPATLTSFIRWCEQNYPANRRELIFWDHGGGSVSGYGYDEKYARSGSMSLAGINQALKDAGTTFDFIGFDACLMATVENGLMLDQYADYMIASEETEPGIGWYYTNWLTALSGNTSMPTIEIGKNIVDDFISTCNRDCRGQSATLSVVDLAELSYTVPTPFKAFSESLTDMISNQQYTEISTARNGTREFARSSAIDQIDLVHFAQNVGNDEGKKLSDVLLSAVKYNRTSSNMTNSYGMSIYFPYRKTSKVDTALNTYDAIGMDSSYAKCIREFASLEVSGQVSTGGTSSPFPSLIGDLGGGSASSDAISNLLGSFLGGDFGSISGLSGSNTGFLTGRSMTEEDTVSYISDHYFDSSKLTWSKNKADQMVISLPEDQWALIEGLDLNMFYDDGEGYVDLGLDNMFDFDDKGNLIGDTDRTWLAINGQPVAYYHEYTEGEGDSAIITGYVPVMLNGERAELLLCFDAEHPHGTITGARSVYTDGQTDTVAKSMTELEEGDTLEFICDFYSYEGVYQDTYYLGEPMTVTDNMEISNTDVGEGTVKIMYRFTDIYQQHYWTEPIEK
ncbi:MAG: peptidase C11 [Oscillospiraceae bacterium]|nr:peptidase C11 [Oscillospiraceae bacterium]